MAAVRDEPLKTVNKLPPGITRNHATIRELDGRVLVLSDRIEACFAALANPRLTAAQRDALQAEMRECADLQAAISEEKVALTAQTYDLLDWHVRRLDEDLRRFQTDMKVLGIDDDRVAESARLYGSALARDEADASHQSGSARRGRRSGGGLIDDLPVDPNEPVYCICKQVAFGEMIGCDSPTCVTEWFHCVCVGVTPSNRPKDKWYCAQCTAQMKTAASAAATAPTGEAAAATGAGRAR